MSKAKSKVETNIYPPDGPYNVRYDIKIFAALKEHIDSKKNGPEWVRETLKVAMWNEKNPGGHYWPPEFDELALKYLAMTAAEDAEEARLAEAAKEETKAQYLARNIYRPEYDGVETV